MIRVNYSSPSLTDTCSFYRGYGPLSELARSVDDFALCNITDLNWATLSQLDVVMIPRVYNENLLQAQQMAINNFKPVWVDYDDNLFCVPRSNPSYSHFANKEAVLARAAETATVVTVTTESLYKTYRTYNKNTITIPNAYNDSMFGEMPHHTGRRRKLVVWRGSNTHDEDLISVADDLVSTVNAPEFSDWKILFVGYIPAYITGRLMPDRVLYRDAMDVIDYFKFMATLNAAIQIVPLIDTEFNRAKSNIAWIEGTVAGAAVYSDSLPEFRKPGITNIERGKWGRTLLESIRAANEDPGFLQHQYEVSRAYIKENLYLSKVNKLREDMIRRLCRKGQRQS